jgi:Tfp pilus assembly protein PilX
MCPAASAAATGRKKSQNGKNGSASIGQRPQLIVIQETPASTVSAKTL